MGRCMGVCTGQVSEEEYKKAISDAADFIKGHHGALIGRLEGEMTEAAQKLQFERAADLRDKINSIRYISEKQNVTILTGKDADVFAFAAEDNDLSFEVLHIRNGKMTGRESFPTEGAAGIDDGIIMTGGGSLLYGLDRKISEAAGVKCHVAERPVDCVALGAGIALDSIDTVTDPTHIYHKKAYIRD